MSTATEEKREIAERNIRNFTWFRVFFSARFYYPVYALLFLDYGLTLPQFGILNGIWAATIVILEIPSGALADSIGRRNLLRFASVCMIFEMVALLCAPIGGGTLLFALFLLNRLLSGMAEAAASGADEALAYDSLVAIGEESRWDDVLERVQRFTSVGFFFAMIIGAAVYDPKLINWTIGLLGIDATIEQADLVKLPIFLNFLSSLVVFTAAYRMKEAKRGEGRPVGETIRASLQQTLKAGKWILATAFPFAILLAAMTTDSIIRLFLTLASEYWKVIELPIASFGFIGASMALLGLFVPKIARWLVQKQSPTRNFVVTSVAVLIGLVGLGFAIPIWGVLPAAFLYAGMQLTGYLASRYLNEVAPSEQRATVLSFRGLSTNFTYGLVAVLYSGWIGFLRPETGERKIDAAEQAETFVESLQVFPAYFVISLIIIFLIYRFRFAKGLLPSQQSVDLR